MSKKEIVPVQYLRTLEGNYAHLYLFSDNQKYVVKFHHVRKYRKREVVNEWLAVKLAQLLDLPVLNMKMVDMPIDSLADLPASRHASYKSGKHLAIPFLEHAASYEELSELPHKENLVNFHNLTGMLVFDQWINNNDRSRTNLLFEKNDCGAYHFWMIDHGRCFPGMYEWNEETLIQDPLYRVKMPVYKWASSLVRDPSLLFAFNEKIMNLNQDHIWNVLKEIPSEWDVSEMEKEKLYAFLNREQLHELPKLVIEANSEYFSTL
ncbi:hypothetical protein RFW18_02000 [Metabacillus idriensis]|uniref:HipA family kinase n=1 Tax=Metabacillus idriensis TaxID=324768 RepID=UPI00281355D7|nr:HipA family kinase [Metabacillus idriensis]MDR0136503.1 hypothetical protein [Metabacillus idriensis]